MENIQNSGQAASLQRKCPHWTQLRNITFCIRQRSVTKLDINALTNADYRKSKICCKINMKNNERIEEIETIISKEKKTIWKKNRLIWQRINLSFLATGLCSNDPMFSCPLSCCNPCPLSWFRKSWTLF